MEWILTLWGVAVAENTGAIFLLVPTRSNKLYQQVLLRPCPCLLWFLDSSLPGMPTMVKNIMGSLLRCCWHSFGAHVLVGDFGCERLPLLFAFTRACYRNDYILLLLLLLAAGGCCCCCPCCRRRNPRCLYAYFPPRL